MQNGLHTCRIDNWTTTFAAISTKTVKVYDVECIVSDYRSVQDTKQPFKMVILCDKETVFDVVMTEIKLSEKPLDEKLFVKP